MGNTPSSLNATNSSNGYYNQQTSYNNPNDGISTPQESQIRQEESRIQNDNKEMMQSGTEVVFATAGAGGLAAANQPIETVMAGGLALHQVGRVAAAAVDKQQAQANYDKMVQEEKQYINQVKNN